MGTISFSWYIISSITPWTGEGISLSTLSVEKYKSMIPAIERNFQAAQQLPISEDYFFEKYLKQKIWLLTQVLT